MIISGAVILLVLAQALFSFSSMTQIRYEDLAESARNPFWMQNGLVYDGVSSSVWWYMIQVPIYNLIGYSLFSMKIIKLVLFAISITCLGLVLKKYLGEKRATLPLLIIGLSPTLLYLNILHTSYGVDLMLIPIILWLGGLGIFGKLGGASLSMVGWLTYPVFVYYLPLLIWLYFWKTKKAKLHYLLGVVAFILPLAIAFLVLKNPQTLLYDEVLESGIFRGAGKFLISSDNFAHNLAGIFTDLFSKGDSYHFELVSSDFSFILPLISLLGILFWVSKDMFSKKVPQALRWLIFWLLVTLLANLIISSLTLDPSNKPGIRRYTPVLASIYGLLVIFWYQLGSKFKSVMGAAIFIILIHHLLVYPFNFSHLNDPSPYAENQWFTIAPTPQESLQVYVEKVQKEDLQLNCSNQVYCRYSEIFAAISGYCLWNKLSCHQILGYDLNTGQMIPLSVDLWKDHYFEH